MTGFVVEPLGPQHQRDEFDCGVPSLDRYLKALATQDVRRHVAAVHVLRRTETLAVVGYYTLSAFALERRELPAQALRRLPAHERLPALLVGRLAIDRRLHGAGCGSRLLVDALARCLGVASQVGAVFVVVHASAESVVPFYQRLGFAPLADHRLHLYLPLATVAQVVT